MKLITNIEIKEVSASYAQVRSMDLLRSPRALCEAVDGAGEPCYADAGTYTTETIKGRRFTRSQWNEEKQEAEIISDVTIGMTADVQNVLGMQAEAWEGMEKDLTRTRSFLEVALNRADRSDNDLLMLIERVKEIDDMTIWQRLKWALFQK